MSGPGLDPTFLDLPYRSLGDAALSRAQALGARHADFRFERIRYQHLGVRDGVLQGAADAEDLGFAVRVIHGGAWGFAAGVILTEDEAVRVAESAVAVAKVAAAMTTAPVEIAPEPTYDDVTWVSSYVVNPLDVPVADKAALLIDWTNRLRTGAAVDHASASLQQVQENKYYADLAGTRTTQQRVRLQPGFEAMGAGADTFDSMSSIAAPVARGWEYLTDGSYDWDDEIDQVPELLAEKLKAPSVEAGAYDLVIHPSNLWLTIHESIGHATELDRALGYEANYAGTSFATYDNLGTLQYGSPIMHVTGDRTIEHGLSTVGYDDEGVQTQSWDIVRDGVLVGYQLDRAMGAMKPELAALDSGQGRSNGCAYADSPGHIPIQRMANVSLQPARRWPVDGGADRPGRARHLRDRRQVVVDRHAALQLPVHRPAVLQDRERRARGPAPRRRLPGDHDRLLGVHGSRRRPGHVDPPRGLQLRQGPTRASGGGEPRRTHVPVPRRTHPQHQRGRWPVMTAPVTPQSLVDHAVATSTADDCIVIVNDKTSANLRWANNTLTTNGVMHGISVTVISFVRGGEGVATGSVSGSASSQAQVTALVEAADAAARAGSPAEDANDLVRDRSSADWDDQPVPTDIHVYDAFAPALGEAFGRASSADRVLYGFVNHEMTTTYLGSTTGLRLRHVQPTGHYGCTGKTSDLTQSAWVGGATRDFTDVDALAMDAELAQRLGWGSRRVDLPAGRYDTILPPTAMADLMIDAYWYAGARVAWEGQSVYSRRPTGTRIGETITAPGVNLFSDPAYDRLECAPFSVASSSGNESSVFDNGLPLERTDWTRDGVLTALLQTRHSAAMTSQPVTPAIDNLVLSIDSASGDINDLVAGMERGLLLTCLWYIREVDPQTLLLTGLTRDGVYLVEGGEITGSVNNFRFNESPIDLLRRFTHASATVPSFSREWGDDYFSRTATPALRVPDFNMSSVSQAM